MKAFEFFAATDANHAVALLSEHGAHSKVKVLAGGTDLLADLKASPHQPDVVVDISRLSEFKNITLTEHGLAIGALVTHTQIIRSPLIKEMFPALVHAAHTIGAVQTRNLGTLGGNLVTAVPSMDSGATLMALEAHVTIVGHHEGHYESRQMPLAEFFVGPRKTVLRTNELLAEILIPKANLGKPTHFLKLGLRKGQALSLVNSAASFWVDWEKNTFVAPRIALGAVAPKVIRAPQAEAYLEGRTITPEAMAEAARLAVHDAKPISDFRASAEYRRHMVEVLTRRCLEGSWALAQKKRVEGSNGKRNS
jgi:CO/xanthine dehydrogenase FAD-binding subunit